MTPRLDDIFRWPDRMCDSYKVDGEFKNTSRHRDERTVYVRRTRSWNNSRTIGVYI